MKWYIVKFLQTDYTQIPTEAFAQLAFRVQMTPEDAKKLKKKYRKITAEMSDGNDVGYDITVEAIDDFEEKTKDELIAALDKTIKETGFGEEDED